MDEEHLLTIVNSFRKNFKNSHFTRSFDRVTVQTETTQTNEIPNLHSSTFTTKLASTLHSYPWGAAGRCFISEWPTDCGYSVGSWNPKDTRHF